MILIITLAMSCNNSGIKEKANMQSSLLSGRGYTTLDTIISFAGLWVNEEYANEVKKTKSPKATKVPEKSCIYIPKRTLTPTVMVFGFHEGGENIIFIKNNLTYEVWSQSEKVKRNDVEIVTPEKIKIGDTYFVKVANPNLKDNNLGVLEGLLFKGHYINCDSSNAAVEFTDNGQVKGLSNVVGYLAMVDYADVAMDIDQIIFRYPEDKMQNFGFKFKRDTLLLYKLKCIDSSGEGGACTAVDFGQLQYRLLKKD